MNALAARLPAAGITIDDDWKQLMFEDRYGIQWQIAETGAAFQSNGELAGRWLDV